MDVQKCELRGSDGMSGHARVGPPGFEPESMAPEATRIPLNKYFDRLDRTIRHRHDVCVDVNRMDDELDSEMCEEAIGRFNTNPVVRTHDEVMKSLGLRCNTNPVVRTHDEVMKSLGLR